MDKWIEPNDSPIWRSLNETHPHLETQIKQSVFQLLQDSQIPPTDKIFPWVIETSINRVVMEQLGEKIETVEQGLSNLPSQISQAVNDSVSTPVQTIQSNQASIERLTTELRKNSVIEASLRHSGWRGVLCSLEAIGQNKMLGLTVAGISLVGILGSGLLVWGLGRSNRQLIQFKRQTIQTCYEKFANDQDGNGWFSCNGFQLPMK